MEIQEIERLAATLKPSGTIERGDQRSVEQRGPGIALRTLMQGNDIIKQTVELPNLSLTYNVATDTLEILANGVPATPAQREEALGNVAHFLRHITNRDQLSQNLLRKTETQLATMAMDDQERTVMSTANPVSGGLNAGGEATIVSATPQFSMMERTTIERLTFDPNELEQKRHLPLPMWSLIALSVLFLATAIVLVIKLL